MTHVDFEAWVTPDLVLTVGGGTYRVSPPSVDRAGKILACTVRAEYSLGWAKGDLPESVAATLDALADESLEDLTLGAGVHREMVDAGLDPQTLQRLAYYAMFYWARGKATADAIGTAMWSAPVEAEAGEGEGKARRPSRSRGKSSPRTA